MLVTIVSLEVSKGGEAGGNPLDERHEILKDADGMVQLSRETLKELLDWKKDTPERWPRVRIAGFG